MKISNELTPWLATEFKKLDKTRDKLKTTAVKNSSVIIVESYKQIQNKVKNRNKSFKESILPKTLLKIKEILKTLGK